MHVPLLDIKAQLNPIKKEVESAVLEVIHSTRYIMGPKVTELEEKIADFCGAKHAIGVSSGTDALLISLMALNVSRGDYVITTPYSFFATVGVIARLGATPIFIDIEKDSYNISPLRLRHYLEKNSNHVSKIKAIIPVHLYGQCADMKDIIELSTQYNIPIVEDAAQAIGASYQIDNQFIKAGNIGEIGCFSFFPSKNLGGIGDGGMVITSDDDLAQNIQTLRTHGARKKYYHTMIGGNFRLDPIQAAALLVKLPYLNYWHQQRQENAHFYDESFIDSNFITPKVLWGRETHVYNQYVISVPERRDDFSQFLREKNIGHAIYYPVPFHLQECFQHLEFSKGDYPNSEHAAEHTLALPIYPELSREQQEYVVRCCKEFYDI